MDTRTKQVPGLFTKSINKGILFSVGVAKLVSYELGSYGGFRIRKVWLREKSTLKDGERRPSLDDIR